MNVVQFQSINVLSFEATVRSVLSNVVPFCLMLFRFV